MDATSRGIGLILFGMLQMAVCVYVWHIAGRALRGEVPPPRPPRHSPAVLRKDLHPSLTGWRKWTLLFAIALGAWAAFIGVLVVASD